MNNDAARVLRAHLARSTGLPRTARRVAANERFRDSRGRNVTLRLLIIWACIALLGVLVFLQVSDPSWRRLGARTLSLRARYGWLAAALLAMFECMVFTRVVLLMGGLG